MSVLVAGTPLVLAQDLSTRAQAWWTELQPTLRDVWGEVHTHKLWYFTWLCLFVCTYLMLRMLITRWGDTNVARKALVLSLLLHFVGGLFTTSLHIATHAGTVGEHPDTLKVRNVIVESSSRTRVNPPELNRSSPRRSGDRVPWDKLPQAPSVTPTRQQKPSGGAALSADQNDPAGGAAPARGDRTIESSPARVSELAAASPNLNSLPVASVRSTTKAPPVLAGGTPNLPSSETVRSRPEAAIGEAGPARQARQPAGLAAGAEDVPTRRGQPVEIASTLPPTPAPALPSAQASAEPRAELRRGGDAGRRVLKPGLVPPGLPANAPGLPVSDENSKSIGKGTPTGNPFARQLRRPTVGNSAGTGNGGENGAKGTPGGTGVGGGGEGTIDQSGIPALPQRLGNGGTGDGIGDLLATRQGGSGLGGNGTGATGSGAGPGSGASGDGLFPGDPVPGLKRGPGGGSGGPGLPGAGGVPSAYRLRGPAQRKRLAVENGATNESERSVELSLQWLANHQNPGGFWDANGFTVHCPPNGRCGGEARVGDDPTDAGVSEATKQEHQQAGLEADAGVTSLAILAFLGAGYKHEEGPYADNIDRALRWLIRQQTDDGFLGGRANRYARMYCHGMATIALGEAYGMTHDESLREPVTRAIQFIIDAQNQRDGGWRYVPGQISDMSIFGWQLMALKSAQTAGLAVPQDTTDRCVKFLLEQGDALKKQQLSTYGGLASYRKYVNSEQVEPPKPSMTAEALFCKQILGIKRTNPAVNEAIVYLEQHPPRRATEDIYYWYYGTLAMYHYGGPSWRRWNADVRELLVAEQRKDGHAAGSWDPRTPWGDFGGRVFSTALSTLTLEVYYRFLPMYRYDEKPRETPTP